MGARDLRRAAVLLDALDQFFPQMQRLEAPYAGTVQGVEMRYGITTHDMDYERARVAQLEGSPRAGRRPAPIP